MLVMESNKTYELNKFYQVTWCTSLGRKILSPLINIAWWPISPVSASCAYGIYSKLLKYIAFAV